MLLMWQCHMQWRVLWSLICNAHNLVLPEKNPQNEDFASLIQIFKLLLWAPMIAKTYPILN